MCLFLQLHEHLCARRRDKVKEKPKAPSKVKGSEVFSAFKMNKLKLN